MPKTRATKPKLPKPFDIDKASRESAAMRALTTEALDIIHAMPHDDRAQAFWQLALDWAWQAKPAMVRRGLEKVKQRLAKQK